VAISARRSGCARAHSASIPHNERAVSPRTTPAVRQCQCHQRAGLQLAAVAPWRLLCASSNFFFSSLHGFDDRRMLRVGLSITRDNCEQSDRKHHKYQPYMQKIAAKVVVALSQLPQTAFPQPSLFSPPGSPFSFNLLPLPAHELLPGPSAVRLWPPRRLGTDASDLSDDTASPSFSFSPLCRPSAILRTSPSSSSTCHLVLLLFPRRCLFQALGSGFGLTVFSSSLLAWQFCRQSLSTSSSCHTRANPLLLNPVCSLAPTLAQSYSCSYLYYLSRTSVWLFFSSSPACLAITTSLARLPLTGE
jgi:hypothetical protein